MLHVVSKDLATFQRLYDDSLLALPHVCASIRRW
ncbi:hypothetical protein [Bradyrhizobium sp. CB1015]